jgi:hypothetical protein
VAIGAGEVDGVTGNEITTEADSKPDTLPAASFAQAYNVLVPPLENVYVLGAVSELEVQGGANAVTVETVSGSSYKVSRPHINMNNLSSKGSTKPLLNPSIIYGAVRQVTERCPAS